MLRNGTLVSGCASHSITLWNATVPTNCKLLKREKSLGGAVFDVIDMHNGLFATSINNSTIIFWNYEGDRIRDINVQNSMCNMYYICKNMIILEHGPNFEYWDHENGKKEISKLFPFEVEAMALLFN
jgi:WD40 repeat protein